MFKTSQTEKYIYAGRHLLLMGNTTYRVEFYIGNCIRDGRCGEFSSGEESPMHVDSSRRLKRVYLQDLSNKRAPTHRAPINGREREVNVQYVEIPGDAIGRYAKAALICPKSSGERGPFRLHKITTADNGETREELLDNSQLETLVEEHKVPETGQPVQYIEDFD